MSATLQTELRKLVDLRERHKKAQIEEEEAKRLKKAQEALCKELMEEAGLTSAPVDLGPGYGKIGFTPQRRIYGKIFDEEAAFEAFEREGLAQELSKPAARKAALNELVRERLENGQPLPEGVSWYETEYIQVTRKKS